jgi:hypothetical protein
MPDYDFHTISPVDFEELTRDLLQARDGIVFQSFKVGRDRGIDLRYSSDCENRIVQCKHFRKSGYAALLRDVRRETTKIAGMRPPPTRYFLSTSVELSDANKEELASTLSLANTQDILGSNDLNNLLGLHPEVEQAHYKLWLSSTAVLQRVLHNAEATQSDLEFKRIRRELPRFVQSAAYRQAADQLLRDRVLVLSGLPGVGKSTIADFLVYEKFSEGFEPIIARNGFQDARALYKEGARQIYYYDDFLGATFLGEGGSAFVRNEDRAITDFLRLIADDEDKLLILTTREHILSEALEESERLRHSEIRDFRYVVHVGAYTADQRARILYNHAYFNRLPRPYLDRLLEQDFFVKIIEHEKYSPRVIEWLTSPRRVRKVEPKFYQEFALRLLDDPAEIWQFAYDRQISQAARSALLALHSLNGRVVHSRLTEAFEILHAERARRYRFVTAPDDFLSALRILSGSFITIYHDAVQFIDPSVRDLMNSILHDAPENCLDVLRGAVSMVQVQAIWALAETRDGEHIEARIETEIPTLVAGLQRALEAPVRFKGEGYHGTFSPSIEERLTLIIELATLADDRSLDVLIAPAVERVIEAWRDDGPNVAQGMTAIGMLGDRGLATQPEMQNLRKRLISALASQEQYELSPSDVAQLLNVTVNEVREPRDLQALRLTASRWSRSMGDRLRDCRSDYELEKLGRDLRAVSDALEINLQGPIQAVDVELQMYVEPEEPEPSNDAWPDRSVGTMQVDRLAARQLFDSLRGAEDE